MFTACQKEELTRPSSGSILYQNTNSLKSLHQYVIFQVGELNENGDLQKGWVITRDGEIRNFEFEEHAWDPSESGCSLTEMDILSLTVGEKIDQVNLEELTNNFKKIEAASLEKPALNVVDQTETSIAFLGYIVDPNPPEDAEIGNSAANAGVGHNCKDPYFAKVLFSVEGGTEATNETAAAAQILAWLKGIKADNNL